MAGLLGGQVQLMFDNLPPSLPHIKAGKLRGLAVTSLKSAHPCCPMSRPSAKVDFRLRGKLMVRCPGSRRTRRRRSLRINAGVNKWLRRAPKPAKNCSARAPKPRAGRRSSSPITSPTTVKMGEGGQSFRSQGRLIDSLPNIVIPAKAGIQCLMSERRWVPAFAGTTILFQRRHAHHASQSHAAMNANPPNGVTAPSHVAPVSASR